MIAVGSLVPTPLNSLIVARRLEGAGPRRRSRARRSASPGCRSTTRSSRRCGAAGPRRRATSRASTSASTSCRRCSTKKADAVIGALLQHRGRPGRDRRPAQPPTVIEARGPRRPALRRAVIVANTERLAERPGLRGRRQPLPGGARRRHRGRAGRRGRLDRDHGGEHRVHARGDRRRWCRTTLAAAHLAEGRSDRLLRPRALGDVRPVDDRQRAARRTPSTATIATNDYLPGC